MTLQGNQVNLIEKLESRTGAMKVSEVCELLGVDDKHIYRMAARGTLPSFHVGGAVRFDPQEVAKWLRSKYGILPTDRRRPPAPISKVSGEEQRSA
jgi:excisionase family DNA binding protein